MASCSQAQPVGQTTEQEAASSQDLGGTSVVYENGPAGPLNLLIWGDDQAGPPRPALILFHGGGWRSGDAEDFSRMCEEVAAQAITCISANYTLGDGDGALQEAKDAVAWVRQHATQLNIKPDRVFVGGGSVGGYLALSTALVAPQEASMPDGLVLLNPILGAFGPGPTEDLKGAVHGPLPPTVVFHGTDDRLSPYANAQAFVAIARSAGSKIDLETYPGRGHGFWNHPNRPTPDFESVTQSIIQFVKANG